MSSYRLLIPVLSVIIAGCDQEHRVLNPPEVDQTPPSQVTDLFVAARSD